MTFIRVVFTLVAVLKLAVGMWVVERTATTGFACGVCWGAMFMAFTAGVCYLWQPVRVVR